MHYAKSSLEILVAFACWFMQAWVPDFQANLVCQALSNPTSRILVYTAYFHFYRAGIGLSLKFGLNLAVDMKHDPVQE